MHASIAKKKTLLLDMDGTLLDLAFDSHYWLNVVPQSFAGTLGRTPDEVMPEYLARLKAVEGSLDWYCLDYWSHELGLDLASLKQQHAGKIEFLHGASEFLNRARAAGFTLVLTTNAHPRAIEIKDQQTALLGRVDRLICAHDVGFAKEDPRFWDHVLKLDGIAAEDSLFVDDSLRVLNTAQQFIDVVAIERPDSRHAARDMQPFSAVYGVAELLP